ncbi:MAG: thermonuclease family protein [Gammaproteobacteria bacterium]|nr:thermonuclease family protein [Gammaproteobacteria bacterium]
MLLCLIAAAVLVAASAPNPEAYGLERKPQGNIEYDNLPVSVVISGPTNTLPGRPVVLTLTLPGGGTMMHEGEIMEPENEAATRGFFKFILLWEEDSPLGDYEIFIDVERGHSDTVKIWSIDKVWENPYSKPGRLGIEKNEVHLAVTTAPPDFDGFVTRVIDGDTIHVGERGITANMVHPVGRSVQLAAVDAPDWNEPGNPEAVEFIGEFCDPGQKVKVKVDQSQPYDDLGRVAADVHCGGKSLNRALVEAGHASVDRKSCKESMLFSESWVADPCNGVSGEPPVHALTADEYGEITSGGGNVQERLEQARQGEGSAVPDVPEQAVEQDPPATPVVSVPFNPVESPLVLLAVSAGAVATIAVAVKKSRKKRWVSTPQRATPYQAYSQRATPQPASLPRVTPKRVLPKGFQQGSSRNTSKAPFKGQRSDKPTQLYECPQCHVPTNSPDITYHDPDAKHPLGWMECKCGFKHYFA